MKIMNQKNDVISLFLKESNNNDTIKYNKLWDFLNTNGSLLQCTELVLAGCS